MFIYLLLCIIKKMRISFHVSFFLDITQQRKRLYLASSFLVLVDLKIHSCKIEISYFSHLPLPFSCYINPIEQ